METKADLVKTSGRNLALGIGLITLGVGLAAGGLYVGETDDAPGAALMGILLAVGLFVFGIKTIRQNR